MAGQYKGFTSIGPGAYSKAPAQQSQEEPMASIWDVKRGAGQDSSILQRAIAENSHDRSSGWGTGKVERYSGTGTSYGQITDPLAQLAERIGQLDGRATNSSPSDSPLFDDAIEDETKPLRELLDLYKRQKFGDDQSSLGLFKKRLGQGQDAPVTANQAMRSGGGFQGMSHQDASQRPLSLPRSPYAKSMEDLFREWSEKQNSHQNTGMNQDAVNAMRRYLQMVNPHKA